MRMRAYAAVAVTAAITLAGCASGRATPMSGLGAPTTSPPTGSPPSTAAGGPAPDPAKLKSALLSTADLGTSFTETPRSSTGPTSFGCPALDALTGGATSAGGQEADFTGAAGHVSITEDLVAGSTADVAAGYAQLKSALAACPTWTVTTGGTQATLRLSPIDFGGPASTAVRLDGTASGTEVNGYVVFENLGTVLLGYVFFQTGGGSSQLAYYEFTQGESKAERVLGVAPAAESQPA